MSIQLPFVSLVPQSGQLGALPPRRPSLSPEHTAISLQLAETLARRGQPLAEPCTAPGESLVVPNTTPGEPQVEPQVHLKAQARATTSHSPLAPKEGQDTLAPVEAALRSLPGVESVTVGADGLHLAVHNQRDGKLLGSLLETSIQGQAVHIDAPTAAPKPHAPAKPTHHKPHDPAGSPAPPKPVLTAEEKVARTYGKLIGHLPHVTGVTPDHAGGRIVVQVDDAASQGMLDAMIADTLRGVVVAFEARPS